MSRALRRLAWLLVSVGVAVGVSVFAVCALATGAEARPPLRVCLETDHPPFSSAAGPDRGIDYEISARIATALSRPLRVEWFDSSRDEEIPMAQAASRLLTETGCDLIAGYPLTRDGLTARTGRLLASQPYLSLPLTVVSAADGLVIDSLDDLIGRRVAVERGSLASVIATVHAGALLQERLLRVSSEADAVFESLESGAADAALVERHRFELYRARTPGTRLRETGYRHPLGVNTGFVGRSAELISVVDATLGDLVATGGAAEIVETRGLGYSSPGRPAILPPLTPRLLAQPTARP